MSDEPKHIDPERGEWTSASNAEADWLCPGRHLAQLGLPESEPSEDSKFGKGIHDALAGVGADALSDDQIDILESCRVIETKLVGQFFAAGDNLETGAEHRMWMTLPGGQKHSGKLDRYYRTRGKALILEYKTLAGDVPVASSNMQLRDQAVLLASQYLTPVIGTAVIQPLVTHSPEICIYRFDDLVRAKTELIERVEKSNTPDSIRQAGEVQCKFCKAKMTCKAHKEWLGPVLVPLRILTDMAVIDWTPEQRKLFCDRRNAAKKWIEDCEDQVKKLIEADPKSVPGWTLESNGNVETVTDLPTLARRIMEGRKIDPEQVLELCTIGKAKLEKLIRNHDDVKGKVLTDTMDRLYAGLTVSKPKAKSLAKIKRQALSVTPVAEPVAAKEKETEHEKDRDPQQH